MKQLILVCTLLALSACDNRGAKGDLGSTGVPGVALVATTIPATVDQCANGGSVILVAQDNALTGVYTPSDRLMTAAVACNGANGTTGSQGQQGVAGQNGTNATPVTIVQFCQGTTVYPSKFLEVGLVINNVIYGVYSANDGFLSPLPPGAYSSNAVGSSCNFTINANNTISN